MFREKVRRLTVYTLFEDTSGTVTGARNVISGNNNAGVRISDSGTTANLVQGNFIGPDVTGTADLGNTGHGVIISGGASNNTVGGLVAEARNIVSANGRSGVFISNAGTTGNLVQGNFIGTDVNGTADLGNSGMGVLVLGASNNTIGGASTAAANAIAFNGGDGVALGSDGNAILGNSIFSNAGLGIDLNDNNSPTIADIVINGIDPNDFSGVGLASGDLNNDGLDDLIIGAHRGDPAGRTDAGETSVLFGPLSAGTLELSTDADVIVNGIATQDGAGADVASGDVNNDGADDLLIGAFLADPGGRTDAGETYVVFGPLSAGTLELSTDADIVINGIDSGDLSGIGVGSGDVNNDGVADLIIGAAAADPGGRDNAGETYVL